MPAKGTHRVGSGLSVLLFMASVIIGVTSLDSSSAAAPTGPPRVRPKQFDQRMSRQLSAYIAAVLEREHVPGASVAIVQNGKIVYQQGFGVREAGRSDPVTPATLMMIGSIGKSMTTMMMATLVDDGKIGWDTPVVQILPSFAVSNSSLTPKITMRHLVCNCTGVQRHDLEIFFPTSPRTASGVIESLRTFPFVGTFGKTFQYSNQMYGAGGYIAARAAGGGTGDLYADYLAQMQRRVFDSIGMSRTTFSFTLARSHPNHATPHGRTADLRLVPVSLNLERPLIAVAPAGGAWSNVQDLARYLIMQLNQGAAPNGKRVVSAKNLKVTWQPHVQITPNADYGLGWAITKYKSARLLNHGGGTSGFTSDLTFLPDANLGIALLTNAQENQIFNQAVRARILELVYGEPMEADAQLVRRAARMRQEVLAQLAQLQPLDLAAVAPYQGAYSNPGLGRVTLKLTGGKLVFDVGTFATELQSAGKQLYVVWDPPLVGLSVKLDRDATGRRTFQLISENPDQRGTWTFIQAD